MTIICWRKRVGVCEVEVQWLLSISESRFLHSWLFKKWCGVTWTFPKKWWIWPTCEAYLGHWWVMWNVSLGAYKILKKNKSTKCLGNKVVKVAKSTDSSATGMVYSESIELWSALLRNKNIKFQIQKIWRQPRVDELKTLEINWRFVWSFKKSVT